MTRHRHHITTYTRRALASISTLTALTLCAACRSATVPEASVPSEVLSAPDEALLENVRGEWVWVTDEARTGLVSVERDGVREVFWGLRRGRRSVELVPITRVPRAWFIETTASPHRVGYVDPSKLQELGGFDDPIATLSPGGQLQWFGPAPSEPSRAVAVPARLDSFPSHPAELVAAPLDVDQSSWTPRSSQNELDPDMAYLVVLDGPQGEDASPRVATYERLDLSDSIARRALGGLNASETFHHQLGHAALTTEADVVLVRLLRSTLIGLSEHSNPTSAPGVPLAPSLVAEPIELEDSVSAGLADSVSSDLHNARWMSAASSLHPEVVSTHGQRYWAELRLAEVFAAAGYPQWTRRGLYADKTYAQAPDFLYVGRGYLLAGDFELASRTLRRAEVAFNLWSGRASSVGQARARALRARALAGLGDLARARALAETSSSRYADLEDWLAAGSTAALAAHYAHADGDPNDSLRLLKVARGYLFHSGAPRASADIELSIAEVYLTQGDVTSAEKMTDYALKRYGRMEDARGERRAQILKSYITATTTPPAISPSFFHDAARTASTRGDDIARRSAVAAHVLARRYEDPEAASQWLDVLREGVDVHSGDYLEPRLSRALALTCAQRPLAADEDPERAADCDAAMTRVEPSPALFDALMTRAWVHVQRDDLVRASRARALTTTLFDEDTLARTPRALARLLLLDAALAPDDSSEALRQEATTRAASEFGPFRRASALSDLAEVSLARGRRLSAKTLAAAAYESASAASQPDGVDRAARLLYDACAQLGDWSCAHEVASRRARASSGVTALEARSRAARAAHMSGRPGARRQILDVLEDAVELTALDAMSALTHGAHAAASMGFTRIARDAIRQVRALEAGLDDALYDPLVGARVRARVDVLDARLLADAGEWTLAASAARLADQALVADPGQEAVFVRLEALYWRARTASNEDTYSYAIREVERLRVRRLTTDALVLAEAARASAEIVTLSGDVASASRILDELRLLGYDTPPVWRDSACLVERVRAVHSGDFESLRVCVGALPQDVALVDRLMHWSVLEQDPPAELDPAQAACVASAGSAPRGRDLWSAGAPGTTASACARGELQRARRIAEGLGTSTTSSPAYPAPSSTKKSP